MVRHGLAPTMQHRDRTDLSTQMSRVGGTEPAGATQTKCSAGQGLELHIHKTLCGVADHLTQEVSVGGLLHMLVRVHVSAVIVRFFGSR
jgi:hypothetical protein